jgi:uracil-DNA glycosylase family 4
MSEKVFFTDAMAQENYNKLKLIYQQVLACVKCEIGKGKPFGCNPHVFVRGSMTPWIVFVGQNPGENEVKQKKPFVGFAGKELQKMIDHDLKLEPNDYLITNSVMCYTPGNRAPTQEEIENCRPWVLALLDVAKPNVVVLLGSTAVKSILQTQEAIRTLVGKSIPWQGTRVFVLPHPASLSRHPANREMWNQGVKFLSTALSLLR